MTVAVTMTMAMTMLMSTSVAMVVVVSMKVPGLRSYTSFCFKSSHPSNV